MSWSIYATGTVEKVRAAVLADIPAVTGAELEEYEFAKRVALYRIDHLRRPAKLEHPWSANAVRVELSGHAHDLGASLKVEVQGIHLEI